MGNVLGAEIQRATPKMIQYLIDAGILFIGEDGQLHVVDKKLEEGDTKNERNWKQHCKTCWRGCREF